MLHRNGGSYFRWYPLLVFPKTKQVLLMFIDIYFQVHSSYYVICDYRNFPLRSKTTRQYLTVVNFKDILNFKLIQIFHFDDCIVELMICQDRGIVSRYFLKKTCSMVKRDQILKINSIHKFELVMMYCNK